MQNRFSYEYAVIRVVPKVEREEFINIGVIIFCKRKKYLHLKYTIDEKKLQSFSQSIDIQLINEYLKAWENVCKGGRVGGKIGEEERSFRFRWLTAYRSTIIQSSRIHPGL
ncbi:MAG: DUF3037 domain-containing protein, partial [Saprospiraceae bacterium]